MRHCVTGLSRPKSGIVAPLGRLDGTTSSPVGLDIRKLMTSDVASTVSNDSKERFSNELKRSGLPKLAGKAPTL